MLFLKKVHNKKGEIYHEIKLGEEDKVVVSNTKALSYIFTKLLGIISLMYTFSETSFSSFICSII